MRPMLVPCPACERHVKSGAAACPFCDRPLGGPARADSVPDTRGWKRAAVFTFGAALTVAGCSSTATGSDAATQDTAADTAPVDTAPADNAPVDAARDAPEDDNGGVAPPYGIPPEDAGPPDNGSMKADYGAPPPRDAGID